MPACSQCGDHWVSGAEPDPRTCLICRPVSDRSASIQLEIDQIVSFRPGGSSGSDLAAAAGLRSAEDAVANEFDAIAIQLARETMARTHPTLTGAVQPDGSTLVTNEATGEQHTVVRFVDSPPPWADQVRQRSDATWAQFVESIQRARSADRHAPQPGASVTPTRHAESRPVHLSLDIQLTGNPARDAGEIQEKCTAAVNAAMQKWIGSPTSPVQVTVQAGTILLASATEAELMVVEDHLIGLGREDEALRIRALRLMHPLLEQVALADRVRDGAPRTAEKHLMAISDLAHSLYPRAREKAKYEAQRAVTAEVSGRPELTTRDHDASGRYYTPEEVDEWNEKVGRR